MKHTRSIAGSVLALLVGIGLAVWGVVDLSSSEVTCGNGTVMSSGDTCVTSKVGRYGSSTSRSVEEQRSIDRRRGYIFVGVGLLMAAGSVFVAKYEIDEARKARQNPGAAGPDPRTGYSQNQYSQNQYPQNSYGQQPYQQAQYPANPYQQAHHPGGQQPGFPPAPPVTSGWPAQGQQAPVAPNLHQPAPPTQPRQYPTPTDYPRQ